MGAWDVGMRSNDSALDAIYVFRNRINKMSVGGQGVLALLTDVANRFQKSKSVTLCVLAVAESLLEQGIKIPANARNFLTPWLGRALVEIRAQAWDDPNARAMALGRFARRVMGERISTEEDNRSLLEGIQKVMRSRP